MDAQVFWRVIGEYNSATWSVQIALLVLLIIAVLISYKTSIRFAASFVLGILHLFIGIVFFGIFGTEPIQKYFALPLFLSCGILFLYEATVKRNDILQKPNRLQILLLVLYALYPICSYFLGHQFPQIVTYIMPCPVVCLGISIYSLYPRKNKALLVLLAVWGLTGVKSIFFNAYEDLILLVCGMYGMFLLAKEVRINKEKSAKIGC
ncbi:MAG: DUF6064 family protein [Sphaerochaeta sp.]